MSRRVALVTGANRGIGAEVARQLAERGDHVLVGSRVAEKGRDTLAAIEAAGGAGEIVALDVSDPIAVSETFASLPHEVLHVLVNNAGADYDTDQTALAANLDRVRDGFETNLFGAWLVTQKAMPLMQRASGARTITNVSSGSGQISSMGRNPPGYSVAKAGLNALTRILAAECEGDGILVNAVCPGWVRTDMGGSSATRDVAEGAASVVWAATLDADGPTGGFFRDGERLDW